MLAMLAVAAIPGNLIGLASTLAFRPVSAGGPTAATLVVSITALELALFGVLYLRIIRPGVLTWQDIGLTSDRAGRYLALGVAVAFALLTVVGILSASLRAVGIQQTQLRLYEGIRGAPLWQYYLLLAAGSGLAPLAEESFFRGYVFTACWREKGHWQAYLFSAALFAAAHFNLPALLPIFVLGLGFAFVRARTGSLVPTMMAHALNNALALSVIYFAPTLPISPST
jgi:membrane protease YdiL (CAAX protease family)